MKGGKRYQAASTRAILLQFYQRFYLLSDEKEWISHTCSSFVCILIATFLGNVLLHIIQKEKIRPEIAAKIAHVQPRLQPY